MLQILKANSEDAEAILALQRLAYQSEARLYNDWTLPALTQTLASLQKEFNESVVLKILQHDYLIGSVRAKLIDSICHIGRLIVAPHYQRQGIGSSLLKAIEGECAHCEKYVLFTGSLSIANIRLYQHHGYTITHQQVLSPTVELTFLEKPNQRT
ncbi:GNAT family N-acetyltransferase [Thiolinea disciformis]|uniref:GNAT family N-acetyltransferase n=1 Tax=Thiolinea disciformis TaxID=125614 RepID=UPI000372F728|nr:GNAT family N-acetyltransferase [Thiolinea disciformis]